jgi:glycosyltransferase involved in cell wall biosynthesis
MTSARASPRRRRRLLHVFSTFGRGGPELRATRIMVSMGPAWEHIVVAMNGDTAASDAIDASVAREFVPAPPRAGTLRTIAALTERIRSDQPDLVATYNWGAIEAVAAARRARTPLVHHEDGLLPDELQRRLRRRSWFRRFVLRSVPVIVPSASLAAIAQRDWGVRAAHLHVLANGVNLQRFTPPAANLGSANTFVTFGTVGGLRLEKDHRTLLRAFAAMQRRDARLVIVGDGPEREMLTAEVRNLGIDERVEFAGSQRDPMPLYRRFDAFVLSSCTEQMPIALLEAMACGLPVIATRVGDVERMLPAPAATLVSPGTPTELAAAMDALAAAPDRRRAEGERNRRHCELHHDAARRLPSFVALYEATAASKPR